PQPLFKLVNDISRTVNQISVSLRPAILDDLGIAAALEWQVCTFEELTGLACLLTVTPTDMDPDQETAIVIYRILQESLTNIMRHAQATKVDIAVSETGGLITIVIKDDGQGIAHHKNNGGDSFGLIGMRERVNYLGGRFEISGSPGKGTTVTAVIPNSRER
ncbi:MAG: sensor histidine kinase, partial [Candidatus Neomarinimicrobiota bacterium]